MTRLMLRQVPRTRLAPRAPLAASSFLLQTRFASTTTPSSDTFRRYVVFDSDLSPELEPVLTNIQNNIILPSYITQAQRDRIFKPELRQQLKTNPVIIEIDDITHRFQHIPETELPSTVASAIDAVAKMKTPADYENLIRLFDGLRHAKRKLKPDVLSRITRILGTRGEIWRAIEAARQAKRTGFKVSVPRLAHDMLFWTQMKAFNANWARAETEKALRWARVVVEMAASPAHKTDAKRDTQERPLARDPFVLVTPLHLAAAIAVAHEGGKDVKGDVALAARQLVAEWPKGKSPSEVYSEKQLKASDNHGGVQGLSSTIGPLARLAMALHCMRLTQQVVEPSLAEHISSIGDAIQADILRRKTELGKPLGGKTMATVVEGLLDESGNIKFDVQAEETPAAEPEPVEAAAEEAATEETK